MPLVAAAAAAGVVSAIFDEPFYESKPEEGSAGLVWWKKTEEGLGNERDQVHTQRD